MAKSKYVKLGAIWKSKKGDGHYISLGNTSSRNEKYNFSVEVTVKDNEGNVLHKFTNGTVGVFDPRKNPNLKEEQLEKLPENLFRELSVSVEQD